MAQGNHQSTNLYQNMSLKEYLQKRNAAVDLCYEGVVYSENNLKEVSDRVTVVAGIDSDLRNSYIEGTLNSSGLEADINRVKAWLISLGGDYGEHASSKGGPIIRYIGKHLTEQTIQQMSQEIAEKFRQDFQDDLTVLKIDINENTMSINADPNKRILSIKIMFMDKGTLNVDTAAASIEV